MYIIFKKHQEIKIYDADVLDKKTLDYINKRTYDKADTEEEVITILGGKITNYLEEFARNIRMQVLEFLMPEIKKQTEVTTAQYVNSNNRYKVIAKTSSDQKINYKVAFEGRQYFIADIGEFSPLEFKNVFEFFKEPTIIIKDDVPINIGKLISSQINIDEEIIIKAAETAIKEKSPSAKFQKYYITTNTFKKRMKKIICSMLYEYVFSDRNISFLSEDFYSFYCRGCNTIGAEPKNVEYLETCNENFQKIIYDAILSVPIPSQIYTRGKAPAKNNIKKLATRNYNTFKKIQGAKIENAERCINERLEEIRKTLANALRYKKAFKEMSEELDSHINEMLLEIARIEAIRYESQEICINISDIVKSEKCASDLLWKGLDYVVSYTYVNEDTQRRIIDLIPSSPELEYPEAREMKRHFILHYGPTNSGKTYGAIKELEEAKSGVYLGPLRLLALEIQDTLTDAGIPCSLLTGEEENIVDNAMHMASTVEKLDTTKKYNVCVIDEAQMINDPERGFAWTRAVLGVQAEKIHICMAPEALNIIKKLIDLCGDTYEEIEHVRRSELVVQKPIQLNVKTIEKGDAYIVFSKKKVLQVAAELVKQGIKVSMIYGNLPYPVRKEQVKRFIKGDTDVVVSTNAIGMGINLPVRRIVFLEDRKFNGIEMAPLTITDVKQIAGRAGRNKETGYVTTILDNEKEIKQMLSSDTPEVKDAYLGFSDVIISIDAPLPDILRVWRSIKTPNMFKRMDIDRYIMLDESIYVDVTKKQKLKMISIPFDERNPAIFDQWKKYCQSFERGDTELEKPALMDETLHSLELYCQALDLWYSFSRNFGYEIDIEWLRNEKAETSEKINDILVKNADMFQKKCECCGKPMHWSNPYKTCKKCHDKMMWDRYCNMPWF